jgi:ribosomal protein S18 acetylase RimI-like enzyme
MDVRHFDGPQTGPIAEFLRDRNSAVVARRGELVDARQHPALVATKGTRVVGVLTYVVSGRSCEVLTLHAAESWTGVGSALLKALEGALTARGCERVWLITTNDNVDALRFYQRRGFHLVALYPGAVDSARRDLKPAIPQVGDHGIPLRDELLLEKVL